jgi:type IV pilus assembly protein PilA
MLTTLRKRMASEESGFTLVELLVVMLILGILAAIAIPSFFNQRDKATDAEAKSAARTAQTAAESYATDDPQGDYSGMTAASLRSIEATLNETNGTPDRLSVTVDADSEGYQVAVASDRGSGPTFTVDRNSDGTTNLTCAPVGGGCPTGGQWD